MTNMKDKIVVITGASSGIGEACARAFAQAGAKLILASRRIERLEKLTAELSNAHQTISHCIKLDVRDRKAVEAAFGDLPGHWFDVEVLVNCAGLGFGMDKLYEGDIDEWEQTIDTNVKGLLYVTRTIVPTMVARNSGHVINIGSIAGREVYPGGNVYCASKFAVKALTRALRIDLLGTSIRVSTVDPGMVETEFSIVRFRGNAEKARKVYEGLEALRAEDIADAVLWVATRPPHVDIAEMVVMPTAQATTILNHRE